MTPAYRSLPFLILSFLLLPAAALQAQKIVPPPPAPAITPPPSPFPAMRRVPLLANPPVSLLTEAARLTVDCSGNAGVLSKVWRGAAMRLNDAGITPPHWKDWGTALSGNSAPLLRINPFTATAFTIVEGVPTPRWEEADALLINLAKGGASLTLSLTPPPSVTREGWRTLVGQAAKRWSADAKFGATRWELAVPADYVRPWYPDFAAAVRAAAPGSPVGVRLTAGDPIVGATALAEVCKVGVPCDSLAWSLGGTPEATGRVVQQIQERLGKNASLKSLSLLPQIGGEAGRELAWELPAHTLRLLEAAPPDRPHPLLGTLVTLPLLLTDEGRPTTAWHTLRLLNRVSGSRLPVTMEDNRLRGLAARSGNGIVLLVWREEGEPRPAEELPALLTLRGLPSAFAKGMRLTRYDAMQENTFAEPLKPYTVTDIPGAGGVEIPLFLPERGVTLLELRPNAPSDLSLSLASPQFAWYGGDSMELRVTIRNTSTKPQKATVNLSSPLRGLVSNSLAQQSLGTIAPGAARALRYRLPVPSIGQEGEGIVQVEAGKTRSTLSFRLSSPLLAVLDTPRVDLSRAGGSGQARVRLTNRGTLPLAVTLSQNESRIGEVKLPLEGKPLLKNISVSAPSEDPGNYPFEITLRSPRGLLGSVRGVVGVPVLCRYATLTPTIDGDLKEWIEAMPMGMGRADQVFEKAWGGPTDLSAIAYTLWDEQFFYFACSAADDVLFPPGTAAEMAKADSVQFAFVADRSGSLERVGYGRGDYEFGLALVGGAQPTLYRFSPKSGLAKGLVAVRRSQGRTVYEAAIPWSELAPASPRSGMTYGISVLVNDNDGFGSGYIEWGGGMRPVRRPGQFPPMRLVKE